MKRFLDELPRTWYTSIQAGSIRGIPDIIGCSSGRFFALEIKRSGKEIKTVRGRAKLQLHNLVQIGKAGGYSSFVYPENFDEVQKDLEAIAFQTGIVAAIDL